MRNIEGIFLARERIIYPNAVYHITHRAPGRELLFIDNGDYLYMLSLIKNIPKKFNWKIFCFCLMSNHIHLLIRIKDKNLSQGAKSLFEKYAKYFNSKYSRKGPVFCKPFRASLCLNDGYLIAASLYVHLNPFKAKISTVLGEYRWSSLNLYAGDSRKQSFVDYSFILGMLNGNLIEARKIYFNLINNAIAVEYKFISQDLNALNKFRFNYEFYAKSMRSQGVIDRDIAKLCDEIERARKIKRFQKPEEIKSIKYLSEQMRANGYTILEIAKMLDMSRQRIARLLRA